MVNVLTPQELGRLTPFSGTPASSDTIPLLDVSTGKIYSATISQVNSGSGGDVVGPGSSTLNAIPRYADTSGKIIKDSVVTVSDDGDISGIRNLVCVTFQGFGFFSQEGGDVIFNADNSDSDFTISKLTAGYAVVYDAGADSLTVTTTTIDLTGAATVTGAITQTGGNVIINNGAGDFDFTAKKNTAGNWLEYDAGADTVNIYGSGGISWNNDTVVKGDLSINAQDIITDTTTGTKIGTATNQKLGFWNATPVIQPATTGTTTGFTAGAGAAVLVDSTFTGDTGTAAYTIGDIVLALKQAGLLAAS